jgi:hypothetical protein
MSHHDSFFSFLLDVSNSYAVFNLVFDEWFKLKANFANQRRFLSEISRLEAMEDKLG